MNLKEVLNYRNRCLICYSKMELRAYDLAGITIHKTAEGLMIETGLKGIAVYFKYDGTYEKMKRWNNLYSKPMSLMKECPRCVPNVHLYKDNKTLVVQTSPKTTVDNIKDFRCAYTFHLWGDSENNFDTTMGWEDIKYNDGDRFYHINTKFDENRSGIISGSYLKDSIDTLFRTYVPPINSSNIRTSAQLVRKIKTYMIFS